MMKGQEEDDTAQKLQQIEINQKKIIAQNDKILSILERINSTITGVHKNRQS